MTVAKHFYDWQRAPHRPGVAPFDRCSPAILSLVNHLLLSFGGKNLGCYHIRNISGTPRLSSHAFGAAVDWRYENPGPGRARLLNEILPFLIKHSKELGIQALHDYFGSRIWRANRSGDKDGGWRAQTPNSASGMGQAWATYLHIEISDKDWADGRPVTDKLEKVPPVEPSPPPATFDPINGHFGDYPERTKAAIRRGASGDEVRYLQGVLKKARFAIAIDGQFGAQTDERVRRFQVRHSLPETGIVNKATWKAIDREAKR